MVDCGLGSVASLPREVREVSQSARGKKFIDNGSRKPRALTFGAGASPPGRQLGFWSMRLYCIVQDAVTLFYCVHLIKVEFCQHHHGPASLPGQDRFRTHAASQRNARGHV